jgi:UDP-N-acetylglucosamine/UDP-N-acetyl-alpha-D-glucosaminouronate 4-epimerase
METLGFATSREQMNTPSRLVVVTGGAGFIGSHLVEALMQMGHRVRVIDNLASGSRLPSDSGIEVVQADITDSEAIAGVFAGVDCVFHLAALARVPLSIEKPLETHVVNVDGTINVLLAARRAGVRRFVFSGSSSVYGEQARLPLKEDMPPNPLSPYALQKLAGEQYTRMFHQLYGLQTLTLRYFNVFGPGMSVNGAYATAIGAFLTARASGKAIVIYGDGEQTRDFTHVRDVVRANLLAMDTQIADGRAHNIGTGRSVSINWIAERIGGPVRRMEARTGEPRHTLADNSSAEKFLGWTPLITTEEGLQELIELNYKTASTQMISPA